MCLMCLLNIMLCPSIPPNLPCSPIGTKFSKWKWCSVVQALNPLRHRPHQPSAFSAIS